MDCLESQYAQYQDEAKVALKEQFGTILREGVRDVVLDFSFWNRGYRDEWRDVVRQETEEGKVMLLLVLFDAEEEVLWRRVEERRRNGELAGRGADDALHFTRAMFERYIGGIEPPGQDEGAIAVKIE